MPALRIKPQSNCPLYRQVYNQLRQAILGHKLPAGARLPSTRALARALGVSRNTVLNAYEALVADALLAARQGSCTHVSMPADKIRSLATPMRRPSDKVRPLATPMRRPFDLWAALREARFPITSVCLRDPDGNPLYLHR
jgi:DNA-binding transcriptional regulator YhcF (GntR family)